MILYRIFTENKHKRFIIQLLNESFESFTIYKTVGYWHNKKEYSLVIEIMQDNADTVYDITKLCRAICGYNQQDCVLVQGLNIRANMVYSGKVEKL